MQLLHVDSSILGDASASRRLSRSIVEAWHRAEPGLVVRRRDLIERAPGHLTAPLMAAMSQGKAEGLTPEEAEEFAFTEELLEEFLATDAIVVGAPMYNFSLPSQLKAWIDRLCQAGRTFRYTAEGAVGLAGGKRVIIASSRGGIYSQDEAMRAMDFQEGYLKTVFGFFGITDITVVRAEGLAIGPEVQEQAWKTADREVEGLFALAA